MTKAGINDQALADKASTSKQQIWKLRHGGLRMSPEWAKKLGPLVGADWAELLGEPPLPPSNVRPAPDAPPLPAFATWKDDLPVYGCTQGGEDGVVPWDDASNFPADMVRRPPGLAGAREAFAMYVVGTSMEPRYEEGERIYVHPRRPTPIGSYVMVIIRLPSAPDQQRAMVKKLVGRKGGKVILEQFNPPRLIELEEATVERVWHVLWPHEIMGG